MKYSFKALYNHLLLLSRLRNNEKLCNREKKLVYVFILKWDNYDDVVAHRAAKTGSYNKNLNFKTQD